MKTVFLFNVKDNSFSIIGTNYNDDNAKNKIDSLRKDGLPAFTIEHDKSYTDKEAEKHIERIMQR